MGKKKARAHKHEFGKHPLTKHQLTRLEQRKRRQRIFMIVGISVIAVVGGIIGGGWYTEQYQPLQETVIRVNDTEFSMGDYVDMLRLQEKAYSQFRGQSEYAYYLQILAGNVERAMEQNELIRQAAEKLGIVVTNEEVKERLNSTDPPLGAEYREVVRAQILLERLLAEYFDQQVPLATEQRHVLAMFLESEAQAIEVRARIIEGEDFGELAGELSLESSSQTQNGDLGWHPARIISESMGLPVVEDYAFNAGAGDLSQPLLDETRSKGVGYWVVKLIDKDEDNQGELYNVQVMILGSEEEAREVITRLESGEDFATLAKELSQHSASKEDGGELGWLSPDEVYSGVEDFVFNAEPGEVSEPIRDEVVVTTGGYWLVQVLAVEADRELATEDRTLLKNKALIAWSNALWDDPVNEVESFLDADKKNWAIARVSQG